MVFISLALLAELIIVLQSHSDPSILFWSILLLLFFTDFSKTLVAAIIIGISLDLYSPTFGVAMVLYPTIISFGYLLTKTFFTNRSFSSFLSVSSILSLVLCILEYSVFALASFFFRDAAASLPDLSSYILHSFFFLLTQMLILTFFYFLIVRFFEKRFGYSVESYNPR